MSQAFKLKPDPTFKAAVSIPLPGGGSAPVTFEFRHRTADELAAWLKRESEDDTASILQMAVGWDLVDPFDEANVSLLVQNYIGCGKPIVDTYLRELTRARLGN